MSKFIYMVIFLIIGIGISTIGPILAYFADQSLEYALVSAIWNTVILSFSTIGTFREMVKGDPSYETILYVILSSLSFGACYSAWNYQKFLTEKAYIINIILTYFAAAMYILVILFRIFTMKREVNKLSEFITINYDNTTRVNGGSS